MKNESEEKALAVIQPQQERAITAFSGPVGFEAAQRMAKALVSSTMVPEPYRGVENIGNAIIALEMAQRMGASPMAVMQNLYIIEGRPSWSSSFIIGALNSCGRFSALRFKIEDLGEKDAHYEYWDGPKGQRTKKTGTVKIHDMRCTAWAYDRATDDELHGPGVTISMAVAEGWYTKAGSKWKTMPELMLRYRAAAFFGRLYAPDVLMGMHTEDEAEDMGPRSKAIDVVSNPVVVDEVADTGGESVTRERGKPSPGKARRTAAEVEEDRLADEADANAAKQEEPEKQTVTETVDEETGEITGGDEEPPFIDDREQDPEYEPNRQQQQDNGGDLF